MVVIYLDQNVWIKLSRVHYGIAEEPKICNFYGLINETSRTKKVIYPLSVIHLMETLQQHDSERNRRLLDFMIGISNGHTILPFTQVIYNEVEHALLKRISCSANSKIPVIGKGISHMLGARPEIRGTMPEDLTRERLDALDIPESLKQRLRPALGNSENLERAFIRWVDSPEGLKWILTKEDITRDMQSFKNSDYQIVKEFEKIRTGDNSITDKGLRYKYTLFKAMQGILNPIMAEIHIKAGLPKGGIIKDWGLDDWMTFVRDIPTFYTAFSLIDRRDRDPNRSIKENDFYDISALAIAIPYCDIVITEKMFASIAKQAKLDSIYSTQILTFSEIDRLSERLQ